MKLLLICICLISFTAVAGNEKNQPSDEKKPTPVALVKKIVKDVKYKESDESDWEIAKTGEPLFDGGLVKTGTKSLALVLFIDGSGLLRVRENSILNIYGDRDGKTLNKNAFLEKGLVGFEVSKQEDEEFKFTTPTMVASIRGTSGALGHEEGEGGDENQCDGISTLILNEGDVDYQTNCGDQGSGSVGGGGFVQIDGDGNINTGDNSNDQEDILNQTSSIDTKILRLQVEEGLLEIEYEPE